MKLRVLEILGYATWGGAAQSVVELSQTLPRDRFEVVVASPRGDAGVGERLREAGVRWVEVPLAGRFDQASFRSLVRLMRRERFDVVHTHCRNADLIGGLAARAARVPALVAHLRGLLVDGEGQISRRWVDRLHRFFLARGTTRLIAISEAVRRRAIERLHVGEEHVVLVRHAVDVRRFTPGHEDASQRDAVRRELRLAPTESLILCVGSLARSKGQDLLLRALDRIASGPRPWRLALVGDGPERSRLEAQARAAGLAERVLWLGNRRDVERLLAAADLVVQPSRWEGFGRVAAEALAAARPLVATRAGGLAEIPVHGVSGWLVEPEDVGALAAAIEQVLEDPVKAARVAARGRERALRRFDLARSTREIGEVLVDVTRAKGIGARSRAGEVSAC